MAEIPVTFEHNSKTHRAVLAEINGAAGHLWHLYEDKYYLGQLILTERGFMFYFQKEGYDEKLSEEFGNVIIAWYQ